MTTTPKNRNSRFGHYRRCDLDFLPSQSFLSMVELDQPGVVERGFYKQRELRVLERDQPRLLG